MNKKEKILEVSQLLYLEKGYSNTSVDEIVSKSGVAKGTFFYHFPTKDDVMYEIINLQFDGFFHPLDQLVDQLELKASKKIAQVLNSVFTSIQMPSRIGLMFPTGIPAQFSSFINEIRLKKLIPLIQTLVVEGINENVFEVNNTEVVTAIVVQGITAYINQNFNSFTNMKFMQETLAGIEEVINNTLKSKERIAIHIT